MSIALPILFALTAIVAILAIWNAIASNWDAILDLRRQMSLPEHGSEIIITFHDAAGQLDAVSSIRRPRQLRVAAPKPITHRLHHFVRNRSVA